MRSFHILIKNLTSAAFGARTRPTISRRSRSKRKADVLFPVVSYLLSIFATDYTILQADAYVTNSQEPSHLKAVDNSQLLWTKAFRCGHIYDEYGLKATFIEDLHLSIPENMRSYWRRTRKHSFRASTCIITDKVPFGIVVIQKAEIQTQP